MNLIGPRSPRMPCKNRGRKETDSSPRVPEQEQRRRRWPHRDGSWGFLSGVPSALSDCSWSQSSSRTSSPPVTWLLYLEQQLVNLWGPQTLLRLS